MRCKNYPFVVCGLLFVVPGWAMAAPLKLTVVKNNQNRRYVFIEKQVPASRLAPPFKLVDEAGKAVDCQWEQSGDGQIVRFVIPDVLEGQSPTFTLDHVDSAPSQTTGITIKDVGGGSISISNSDHEITRYNVGAMAQKFKKP